LIAVILLIIAFSFYIMKPHDAIWRPYDYEGDGDLDFGSSDSTYSPPSREQAESSRGTTSYQDFFETDSGSESSYEDFYDSGSGDESSYGDFYDSGSGGESSYGDFYDSGSDYDSGYDSWDDSGYDSDFDSGGDSWDSGWDW
jgi:hypothetical protein